MHYMRCYPVHKVKQGKMEKFLHWQEILCVTCDNGEQTIFRQKGNFFQADWTVFRLGAWSKHIVSACEAFLHVAKQSRPDSLAVSQRYNDQEYSLSLCIHTHSTIFHSNTPKQTPNRLQYFREMAKALRYFPYCPLEQLCVLISTKVEICIAERKEISFRREHKQKQVLVWSGFTLIPAESMPRLSTRVPDQAHLIQGIMFCFQKLGASCNSSKPHPLRYRQIFFKVADTFPSFCSDAISGYKIATRLRQSDRGHQLGWSAV